MKGFFHKQRRARDGGRGVVLGKRTLIYNKLPRFPWLDGEVTIRNSQVRTDFFQKIPFLFLSAVICQKNGLFCGFYEPNGRFEPVSSVLFGLGQLLLEKLSFFYIRP